MSEASILSIGALVGFAAVGIGKLIGSACGAVIQYQPKNEYLATPQREMLLQSLYARNFAAFEFVVSRRLETFNSAGAVVGRTQARALHTIAMYESVSQIESMAYVVGAKHEQAWKKVGSLISQIKDQLGTPAFSVEKIDQLTENSESLIRRLANDAHSLLARAEEKLLLSTVAQSMSSLAYKVRANDSALIASRGAVSVRADVARGRLKLDTTSFPGISCHAQIQRIEKQLEKRGLVLRRLCENAHNLRKDRVRLKDLFPVCPDAGSRQVGKTAQSVIHADPLVQRYLRQLDHNLIKETVR